jgi:hypothetical protein
VDFYYFLRGTLAWTATVAILLPFNIPLAALAYKIRLGTNKNPFKSKEYWGRSALVSLVVAGITAVALVLDNFLTDGTDFPPGPIHLVVFMAYVPAAMWAIFWFFALEDPMQALSVFVIYFYLPMPLVYLLHLVIQAMLGWDPYVDIPGNLLMKVPT